MKTKDKKVLSFLFICLLSACGPNEGDGTNTDGSRLDLELSYATSSRAITIGDIPEGLKDYTVVEVFRGADVINSSTYSSPTALFSETFGADQSVIEIYSLPVNEVLIIEVTTFNFSGERTYVGRTQKTLSDGIVSNVSISMKPLGLFLKDIVSPIAKPNPYGYGRDRVEFRYSILNNTLFEANSVSIDARILTAGLSGDPDDNIYSTFKPFTTKLSDGSFAPYLEIPDGFRNAITLEITIKYSNYSKGDVSTIQTVTFNPDYSSILLH